MTINRIFFAGLLIGFGASGLARADDRLAVDLARVCVSEAGWNITPDCAGILSALRNRADKVGTSLPSMMRAYSRNVFNIARSDRRRWLAHLDSRGTKPEGWPAHVSWDVHRPKWQAMIVHARELLADDSHYPTAEHWGMTSGPDLERALRAGWIRVHIEGARNAFWAVR